MTADPHAETGAPWPEAALDEIHRLSVEVDNATREIKRLSRYDDWRRVAQGFTPGGSEYQTPAEVEAFMRRFRELAHEAKCDRVRLSRSVADLLDIAKRWAALDGGAWHVARHAREKAHLLAFTEIAIASFTDPSGTASAAANQDSPKATSPLSNDGAE